MEIATAPAPIEIPKALILEEIDGQSIYYRGYREVLSGEKTIEELTGSSIFKSYLVSLLLSYLNAQLPERKFLRPSNLATHGLGQGSGRSRRLLLRPHPVAGRRRNGLIPF